MAGPSKSARSEYDLGHYCVTASDIGRLQTLSTLPVVAGDTWDLKLAGLWRLAPLRRQLLLDALVDVFVFFVPHRHVYGESWVNFILGGVDENVTFATGGAPRAPFQNYGSRCNLNPLPLWLPSGYARIWNRYFRHPTWGGELGLTSAALSDVEAEYGRPCGHLPTIWSTPIQATVDTADYRVALQSTQVDLLDLARGAARLKTERKREWMAPRYRDLLESTYGTSVNIDADERPELCYRKSFWLSGYDVDGTDQSSLGTFAGKSAISAACDIPPKYFNEHGTLWVMALVRFPAIAETEQHFLESKNNWSYKEIAGDPDVLEREAPVQLNAADIFGEQSGTTNLGLIPYGQWYRYNPSRVHHIFDAIDGFPFLRRNVFTAAQLRYIVPGDYDAVFNTLQLRHWQVAARLNARVRRYIPDVRASIFAGTR